MRCTFVGCKNGFLAPDYPGLSRLTCPNCRGTGRSALTHRHFKEIMARSARYHRVILANLSRRSMSSATLADNLGATNIWPVRYQLRKLVKEGLIERTSRDIYRRKPV